AVCRPAAGDCDVAETCDGTSTSCPADAFLPTTALCRASAGECDPAEFCTGSSAGCPADAKSTAGRACSDDGNPCSRDECDGGSNDCQHPAGHAGTVCRPATDDCDQDETCDGTHGPDVTCEWSAGSNLCPSCAAGSDGQCPTPKSECGKSFVSSRQSSAVSSDMAHDFVLAPGSIDNSNDGPDFGVINAPTQDH